MKTLVTVVLFVIATAMMACGDETTNLEPGDSGTSQASIDAGKDVECRLHSDCPKGELCKGGTCASTTTSDAGVTDDAGICIPQCVANAKACGFDGCGSTCGTCSSDELCQQGICVSTATPDAGTDTGTTDDVGAPDSGVPDAGQPDAGTDGGDVIPDELKCSSQQNWGPGMQCVYVTVVFSANGFPEAGDNSGKASSVSYNFDLNNSEVLEGTRLMFYYDDGQICMMREGVAVKGIYDYSVPIEWPIKLTNSQYGSPANFKIVKIVLENCADGKDNNCNGQIDEGCICIPQCANRACGFDGCNSTCGTCAAGELCEANGTCVKVETPDAGTPDAGDDAGTLDAGNDDVGTPDSGTPDAGQPDTGDTDAGTDAGADGGTDAGSMFTVTCIMTDGQACKPRMYYGGFDASGQVNASFVGENTVILVPRDVLCSSWWYPRADFNSQLGETWTGGASVKLTAPDGSAVTLVEVSRGNPHNFATPDPLPGCGN